MLIPFVDGGFGCPDGWDRPRAGKKPIYGAATNKRILESLIDRFVEQLDQVFMLRVFHIDTIC